jgi:hypothetical protein
VQQQDDKLDSQPERRNRLIAIVSGVIVVGGMVSSHKLTCPFPKSLSGVVDALA